MAKIKCHARTGSFGFAGLGQIKACNKVATVIQTHTVAPFVSPTGKTEFNREGGTYANAYCDRHKHSDAEVVRFGMTVETL